MQVLRLEHGTGTDNCQLSTEAGRATAVVARSPMAMLPHDQAVAGPVTARSFNAEALSSSAPNMTAINTGLELTLFLSLAPPSAHFGAHYAEMLAAIRANVVSHIFREVIIWYEDTSNETCATMIHELVYGITALEQTLRADHNRLRCWPRAGGQPTYGELFVMVLESARQGRLQAGGGRDSKHRCCLRAWLACITANETWRPAYAVG